MGEVACQGIDVHHRRLPLVQGSLEIPIQVTVTMDLYRRKERTGDEKIQELVNEWSEPRKKLGSGSGY